MRAWGGGGVGVQGVNRGYITDILGIYWNYGKEHGNDY